MDLLAILGRGIQRVSEDGPWVLTEDLEVCGQHSAHLPVRVPADDKNPYCMVGGGEMNLEAGIILCTAYNSQYKPGVVVCAYGDRSDYLKSVDGPTESTVMAEKFTAHIRPSLSLGIWSWPQEQSLPGPSNTGRELLNIFEHARDEKFESVGLVTVGVHMPRTMTYIAKHLTRNPRYRSLHINVFESEKVLLEAAPERYAGRVATLRNSKSFARTWKREADGISKIIRGVYGDAKPRIETEV